MDSCPRTKAAAAFWLALTLQAAGQACFLQGHTSEPCTQSKAAALQSKAPSSNQTGALLFPSVLPEHGVSKSKRPEAK